jgi:hypothetical protein
VAYQPLELVGLPQRFDQVARVLAELVGGDHA